MHYSLHTPSHIFPHFVYFPKMLRTSQNLIKKNSTTSCRVRTNELPVCWSLAERKRDGDRLSCGHRASWPPAAIKFIANLSIAKVFEVIPSSLWTLLLNRLHSLLIICSVSGRMGNAGNSYCHLATISAAQCAFLFLAQYCYFFSPSISIAHTSLTV